MDERTVVCFSRENRRNGTSSASSKASFKGNLPGLRVAPGPCRFGWSQLVVDFRRLSCFDDDDDDVNVAELHLPGIVPVSGLCKAGVHETSERSQRKFLPSVLQLYNSISYYLRGQLSERVESRNEARENRKEAAIYARRIRIIS